MKHFNIVNYLSIFNISLLNNAVIFDWWDDLLPKLIILFVPNNFNDWLSLDLIIFDIILYDVNITLFELYIIFDDNILRDELSLIILLTLNFHYYKLL